jgi:hypothetical protein
MDWKEFKEKFYTDDYAKIAATAQAIGEILPLINGFERMIITQAHDMLRQIAINGQR